MPNQEPQQPAISWTAEQLATFEWKEEAEGVGCAAIRFSSIRVATPVGTGRVSLRCKIEDTTMVAPLTPAAARHLAARLIACAEDAEKTEMTPCAPGWPYIEG